MPYDPALHHRRSVRLQGYDYSQAGAYFVTVCTHHRSCFFGMVVDGAVHLNEIGQMVQEMWDSLPKRFPGLHLDVCIVMPNHVHGVLVLDGRGQTPLGQIIGAFKSLVIREYAIGVKTKGWERYEDQLWQRNYYEHVIRSEEALEQVRAYIVQNAARWDDDPANPSRHR